MMSHHADEPRVGTPLSPVMNESSSDARGSLHASDSNCAHITTAPTREASLLSSRSAPILHQQPAFVDAINNAWDPAATEHTIDPKLINIIADQVFKQLQTQYQLAIPAQTFPQSPQSPDFGSVSSLPARYTPPSPQREFDAPRVDEYSDSLSHMLSVASSNHDAQEDAPVRKRASSQESVAVPRALSTSSEDTVSRMERGVEGEYKLRESASASDGKQSSGMRPQNLHGTPGRVESIHSDQSLDETTALEKAWQPLFQDGKATARLGQFLRGLAKHLIDDYEPKASLVVTPEKMLRFFDATKVASEIYPWPIIFGEMKFTSISIMYRKLLCQHHFVQANHYDNPNIPGLTPCGFQSFMTYLIEAHPDIEFQRLAQTVRHMPISNADDSRERFPKELSRRLLPARGQVQAEQRLISSLNHEISLINLEHAAATMPPPPRNPPLSHSVASTDQENLRRSPPSPSCSTEDEDELPPAVQLERERKPYRAREGSGKIHDLGHIPDEEHGRTRDFTRARSNSTHMHPNPNNASANRPTRAQPIPTRSTSTRSTGRHYPHGASAPDAHRKPVTPLDFLPPPNDTVYHGSGRRASSPPRYNYARNDQSSSGNPPPAQYSSSLPNSNPRDVPFVNDPRRYSDGRPLERARTAGDAERARPKSDRRYSQGYP